MLSLLTKTPVPESGKADEANPYWISFSDIMAGLLVIFILAALQLMLQLTQREAEINQTIEEIEKANQVRSELLADIKTALDKKGIEVHISDNDSVLRIPATTLNFASDSAQIPEQRKETVEKIGIALLEGITSSNRSAYIDTIFVEGHTDSWLSMYKGVGNWLLSADRAVSVWQHWGRGEATKELHDLENGGKRMFSVSGYAETRRVEENDDTDAGRERNRRIDLRFTMKQPRVCDYQEALGINICSGIENAPSP